MPESLGVGASCLEHVPDEALRIAVRMNQQRRREHAARLQLNEGQGKHGGITGQTHVSITPA